MLPRPPGHTDLWTTLDERSGVRFPDRHVALAFTLPPASRRLAVRRLRLAVGGTRDPRAANSVQLGAWRMYVEGRAGAGTGGEGQVRGWKGARNTAGASGAGT